MPKDIFKNNIAIRHWLVKINSWGLLRTKVVKESRAKSTIIPGRTWAKLRLGTMKCRIRHLTFLGEIQWLCQSPNKKRNNKPSCPNLLSRISMFQQKLQDMKRNGKSEPYIGKKKGNQEIETAGQSNWVWELREKDFKVAIINVLKDKMMIKGIMESMTRKSRQTKSVNKQRP